MTTDEIFMQRCIQIARIGEYYVAPNPMVGAVLVRDGHIIAEGWHRQYGGPHAEVNCFREADERGYHNFTDCTLYVSLEPCSHYGKTPPCANLIVEKHPARVVVGQLDPNPRVAGRGIEIVRAAGIEVEVGVLEEQCRALNKRFLCLHEQHRPYVILKWAQTRNGYIDSRRAIPNPTDATTADHRPLVISTPFTKQLVHKMRAENMAIMVGTRTVLLDNPRLLNTRWRGRNPIRVTLDRHHVLPADSRIFSSEAETIVYQDNTDWSYILSDLATRGIHSLIVEGGTTWLHTILESGIYDEVHVEIAPVTTGDGVVAPKVDFPDEFELFDGNRIYEWHHTTHH